MNLYSLFLKNFNPSKKLIFNSEEISFNSFRDNVEIIYKNLINFKNLNKIAILSNNPKLLSQILLASAKLGKVIVTLNSSLAIKQINLQLKIIRPDILILDNNLDSFEIKYCKKFVYEKDLYLNNNKINLTKFINKNFLFKDYIITLSSGTTSIPKPILYSQKTKYLRFLQMKETYRLKKSDNIFSVSPIDHSLGQRLLFLALLNGSNFIYINKYDFNIIKKYSTKYNLSFTCLPPNYLRLLKKSLINKKIKIKKIVSAASTLTNNDKKTFIKKGINLYEMYGAAEIGTVTNIEFKKNLNLVKSVGKPLKNIDIKIINEKNKFLKNGLIGEIVCKTPLRFKHYYNNKLLTKKSFIKNYFKTGDIGMLDNKKNLYFLSRKQDVIISGGKNIYPIDIENELLKLNYIKDAAVIGINDKFFGEIVYAVCVLSKFTNNVENKIKKHLAKSISKFQIPLGFSFTRNLPKNNLGKVQKFKLREKFNSKKFDFSNRLRKILNK